MKKKLILFAVALIATVGVASAQNMKATANKKAETRKSCYVDANKDGICDKYAEGTCKEGNGKGLQDGSSNKKCKQTACKNNTNTNCKQGKCGKGNKTGKGLQDGSGCDNGGKGAKYVDADNNGTCDRKEAASRK